jgi:hypothetical protein
MSFEIQDFNRKVNKLTEKHNAQNTKYEALLTKFGELLEEFEKVKALLPAKETINGKLKAAKIREALRKCYGVPKTGELPAAKSLSAAAIRERLQIEAGSSISPSDLMAQLKIAGYPPQGRNSFLVLEKS